MNNGCFNNSGLPPYSDYQSMCRAERKELRRTSNIISFGLLALYALSFLVMLGLYFWAGCALPPRLLRDHTELIESLIQLVAYVLSFLLPTVIMIYWIRIPRERALPMKTPQPELLVPGIFCCLGSSILGAYLTEGVSSLVEAGFGVTPIMPDLSAPTETGTFILYLISVVLAPAFLEEMLFRGVIMQSLRRFGDGFAIVASSILFAMAHGNLVQGPNTLVVGMAIGFFVIRTGSLWTGIIIHFLNNGIAVGLEMATRHADAYPWLVNMLGGVFFIVYFVAPAISVFYLLTQFSGVFRLAPSRSTMSTGKRYAQFFSTVLVLILIVATIYITSRYFQPV